MEIDPTKILIVQSCLDAAFKDVRPDKLNGGVVFNDGGRKYQLEFDSAFIDDIPREQLKTYMETTIIPKMRANPGKKIYVSNDGIEIMDKDSN